MNEIDLYKNIDENILKEIYEYCDINNISYSNFINEKLKNSIIIEKYGEKPPFFNVEKQIAFYEFNIKNSKKENEEVDIKKNVKQRKISAK